MEQTEPSRKIGPPQGLVPVVVTGLIDRIHQGEFAPGIAVPTVSSLSDEYGVSRTVIREALRILQEKGLIDTRQGSGTVVRDFHSWNLLDPEVLAAQMRHDPSLERLDQLMHVRAAIESEIARVVSERITDDEVEHLRVLLKNLEDSQTDPVAYARADLEFHQYIMSVSRNDFGRLIVSTVVTWARSVQWPEEQLSSAVHTSFASHEKVFKHISTHDSAGAAEAMRQHIMESWGTKLDALFEPNVG